MVHSLKLLEVGRRSHFVAGRRRESADADEAATARHGRRGSAECAEYLRCHAWRVWVLSGYRCHAGECNMGPSWGPHGALAGQKTSPRPTRGVSFTRGESGEGRGGRTRGVVGLLPGLTPGPRLRPGPPRPRARPPPDPGRSRDHRPQHSTVDGPLFPLGTARSGLRKMATRSQVYRTRKSNF